MPHHLQEPRAVPGIKQGVQGGRGPVLRMRCLASPPWACFYLRGLLLNSKYILCSSHHVASLVERQVPFSPVPGLGMNLAFSRSLPLNTLIPTGAPPRKERFVILRIGEYKMWESREGETMGAGWGSSRK